MCWQCDNPDRTIEDHLDEVREDDSQARLDGAVRREQPDPVRVHDRTP